MKQHLTTTCALSALLTASALASPTTWKNAVLVSENGLLDCYDYIVAGGGTSGLVVANRLSADGVTTVLVVEAGPLDNGEDYVTIPALAGGAVGTKYDWNLTYVSNPDLDSRNVSIPQGKVVGGSSLFNRMLFDRGSKGDYDRWEQLGSTGWNWNNLLPSFKKSEKFTPPNATQVAQYHITYDAQAHGTTGYVQSSFSNYIWPAISHFVAGVKELGIKTPHDGANGEAIGGFWVTHSQNPVLGDRSSSRIAYYNSAQQRKNLHLLTSTRVTKILTSKKKGVVKTTGIQISASRDSKPQVVNVNKEVVLSAGALHTPQLLLLSGIGDTKHLSSFNISTVVNLPGVGRNFQDHVLLTTVHSIDYHPVSSDLQSNATFANAARAQYNQSRTGPYTGATADYLVFLPGSNFTTNITALSAKAAAQTPNDYLDADTPSTVSAGYAAQHKLLTTGLTAKDLAIMEFIWGDGAVVLGLQHPFSRGSIKLGSANVFDPPLADSAFLRNPLDLDILVEGVKFVRSIYATSALTALSPVEILPGANVTSDADLQKFVRQNAATIYHPVGSCSLAPLEKGGCVDASLRVYGVSGLRVVDASVMPMLPATHTQSTVYAVAEKAASIILQG
ncbi:hypothetical protein MBLNU459_g5833t1 [Dothideomycetes sp. NU459]